MFETNLAAINAARKQLGADWKEHASVEKLGHRQWTVQMKQPAIDRSNAWESLIVPTEGAYAFPTSYSVEMLDSERRRQEIARAKAFFASRPAAEPLSEEEQAAFDAAQANADAAANNAESVSDADYLRLHQKCPKCGSDEVFLGYSEQIGNGLGKVIDDDRVGGCHACDFAFDERGAKKSKVWVRQSTVDKPVKRVWAVADEMIAADPNVTRKEVQAECVRRGIASGTARTQYQAWSTARKAAALNQAHADALSAKLNNK